MSLDLEGRVSYSLHRVGDGTAVPTPDLADVETRVRARKRRRLAGGMLAAVTVLVATGAVALTRDSTSSPRVRVGTAPSTVLAPKTGSARPVLDNCTPTFATESVSMGAPVSVPAQAAEVFADPARGASGPLAVVIRTPGTLSSPDGSAGGLIATSQIDGRDANLQTYPEVAGLPGGANWDLAGGGTAYAFSRGLSAADLRLFVEQIDMGTTSLPVGLVSFGMTGTATSGASTCTDATGIVARITEIRGTPASRYAQVFAATAGASRFDTGDSTIVIDSFPGKYDATNTNYHEATPAAWARLLAANPARSGTPTGPAAVVPPTAAPTTAAN